MMKMLTMKIDMDDDKVEDKRPLLNWRRMKTMKTWTMLKEEDKRPLFNCRRMKMMKMLTMRIDMDDDKEEDKDHY